jgi:hypothetical protein
LYVTEMIWQKRKVDPRKTRDWKCHVVLSINRAIVLSAKHLEINYKWYCCRGLPKVELTTDRWRFCFMEQGQI